MLLEPPSDSPLLPFHEWAALRTELIWIYDHPVFPGFRRLKGRSRISSGYRAWLLRRGSVSITTSAGNLTVAAGHWIMPVPGAIETIFSDDAHLLSLHFLCQWPSGENVLRGNAGITFASADYPDLARLAGELHGRLQAQFPHLQEDEYLYSRQSSRFGEFLAVQGLFLSWLGVWFQSQLARGARVTRSASGDNRAFQAARCLNHAPLHQGFPATQLQRETGLGLMRLNQLFFAEFGLTTRKYWDRRRLELARQCLETSDLPMKEIAFRLGFRSDSHFVIWFRRLAGSRPGDFRKAYRAAAAH